MGSVLLVQHLAPGHTCSFYCTVHGNNLRDTALRANQHLTEEQRSSELKSKFAL